MRHFPVLVLIGLSAVALGGCFGGKNPDARCNDEAEYQASSSIPDLKSPEGLSVPSSASVYSVPAKPPGAGDVKGAACLPRPPDFFRKDPAPAPAPAK